MSSVLLPSLDLKSSNLDLRSSILLTTLVLISSIMFTNLVDEYLEMKSLAFLTSAKFGLSLPTKVLVAPKTFFLFYHY